MTGTKHDIGWKIANELATCGVKLIASLPDNWLMDVIDTARYTTRTRGDDQDSCGGLARHPDRW
jgi:hypothetical protein